MRETETRKRQRKYTYRQSVTHREFDGRGAKSGGYTEVRDIVFSPQQERAEQVIGKTRRHSGRLK